MSDSKSNSADPGAGAGPVRWLILAAIIAVSLWFGVKALREAPEVGAAASSGSGGGGMPPSTVIVQQVQLQLAQEKRRVTGSLRAVARAEVAAREAGAIAEVRVDEGQSVKQGDLLAVLDARRIDAELAEAKARVTAAEAVVTQRAAEAKRALTDFERKQTLFKTGAVSEGESLDAERESAVATAGASVATAELAALSSAAELMNVRRTDLEILAPFDGRIVARHVEPGEWLTAGSPVVTMVSTGQLEAWLNVPERYASEVAGLESELSVVSESTGISSKVTSVTSVSDIDPTTRLFPVVATVDDLGGKLIAGMSVIVDLPVGAIAQRLAVPVDALVVAREQAYVFRPSPGEPNQPPSAEKVLVREIFRSNGIVFVESDTLKAGDLVVTEGNERLFPGTSLIVNNADSAEAAAPSEAAAP